MTSNVFDKLRLSVIKKAGVVYVNAIFIGKENADANIYHNLFTLPSSAFPINQIDSCCVVQNGLYNYEGNGILTIEQNGKVNISTNVLCWNKYVQFSLCYLCV